MGRIERLFLALFMVAAMSGCKSGPTVFVHANADFGSIRKIGILPFEALTQDKATAEKVQKMVITEILSLGAFEVVEPGQVQRVLREHRIESLAAMTPQEFRKVGESLGAQALLSGTVIDFGEGRSGTVPTPEVTIQMKMIETQSGITIWSVDGTRAGAKWSVRLFGIGGETVTQAARTLIRQEIETILVK